MLWSKRNIPENIVILKIIAADHKVDKNEKLLLAKIAQALEVPEEFLITKLDQAYIALPHFRKVGF